MEEVDEFVLEPYWKADRHSQSYLYIICFRCLRKYGKTISESRSAFLSRRSTQFSWLESSSCSLMRMSLCDFPRMLWVRKTAICFIICYYFFLNLYYIFCKICYYFPCILLFNAIAQRPGSLGTTLQGDFHTYHQWGPFFANQGSRLHSVYGFCFVFFFFQLSDR